MENKPLFGLDMFAEDDAPVPDFVRRLLNRGIDEMANVPPTISNACANIIHTRVTTSAMMCNPTTGGNHVK